MCIRDRVLAEYHLKLVETEQSLAAESLHEVLVGIGSRRVVEEVLAQLWGDVYKRQGQDSSISRSRMVERKETGQCGQFCSLFSHSFNRNQRD